MGHRVAELEVVVNANTGQAQRELNNLNRTFHNIIAGGALMGAGGGLLNWFKDSIASGAQFEQTMIRVQQLATGAEVSVDALTKKAFAVDQATIYSAQQIAEAMEQLGREGFTGEQILSDWTDAAVNFAAVINEDLTQSANIFGQVARVFRREGLSAARTADILSQAILRSGRPAAEFATGMQYIGSIAADLGVPLEETATTLSYLQSIGIKGRSAGTGLRSLFIELAAGADAFGMSHGVQAFDPETGAFVGMPAIISQFEDLLGTMTKAEGLTFLTDLFGKPAASPLYALFSGGTEAYDEHLKKMEDLGPAAKFMETLMDTIAGSLDRFEAAASNAMRQIGVIGGNMIRPFLDVFTALLGAFSDAPQIVHIAAAAFVVLTGALMGLAGAIMVFRGLGGFGLLFSGLGIMGATFLGLIAVIGGIVAAFVFFRDELGAAKDAVLDVLDPIMTLFDYLSRIDQGNNPLEFLLAQGWDGPLLTFAEGLGEVVEGLADLWYFISRGDWERFMRRLPGELEQMWNGVKLAFSVLPEVIGFDNWEDMVLSALAWTGENLIFDPIVAVIEGSIQLLGDLADAAGNLWGWVKNKIGGNGVQGTVDASGNKIITSAGGDSLSVGDVLIGGTLLLGEGLAEAAGNLWGWVERKLMGEASIGPPSGTRNGTGEWNVRGQEPISLGEVIITGALDLADDFWGTASDVGGWIENKIRELGDIFVNVEGIKIRPIDVALAEVGGEGGGEGGSSWVTNLGTSIGDFLAESNELITEAGKGFGKLIGNALDALSPDDMDTALVDSSNFGQNIGAFIHDVMSPIVKSPIILIQGIASFIAGAIGELSLEDLQAVPDIGANVIAAIGGFLAGLLTGEDSAEWSFGEFAQGLGNKIGDAIRRAFNFALSGGIFDSGGSTGNAPTGLYDEMGEQITAPDGFIEGASVRFTNFLGEFIGQMVTDTLDSFSMIWDGVEIVLPAIPFSFDVIERGLDRVGNWIDEKITWLRDKLLELVGLENEASRNAGPMSNFFQIQNYDPLNPNNHMDDRNTVIHSPGEGYAIPQGAPYQGSLTPENQVEVQVTVEDSAYRTFKDDLAADKFEAEISITGIDSVMTDFAAAFDMGRAWASTTHEAKADLNVDSVMIAAAASFDIGRAWAGSTHTGAFDLNVDAAMTAAAAAFDIGRAWAGSTFTASFSVDVSGLLAARDTARQVAADIAAVMPHSPAKEGPLKEPITFDYIGENFGSVADDIRYSANRLTSDVAGLRNRNMAPVDVAPVRSGGGVTHNYYFAVTGDDLARLERQSREGSLDLESTARELEMTLGMN